MPRWENPSSAGVALAVPPLRGVVRGLLIANVAIYLAQELVLQDFFPRVLEWLVLYPLHWKSILLPVWQLVSYGFLHASPMHLVGNMLFLYFLGTMLEDEIGPRRFALFYGLGVVLAGLAQLVLGLALGQLNPILGASGAVLAIVCAMATLRPDTRIIFIIVPLTLKTVALIYVAGDLLRVVNELKGEASGVASFAHLTGALFGFLAVRRGWIWRDPLRELGGWRERLVEEHRASDEERLDELLAKIAREGIHALSAGERAFLKRMSQRR